MTSLTTTGPLDLTVHVGSTSTILGVNMEITQRGIKGWYGGGVPVRTRSTARLNQHGEFSEPGKRGARLVSLTGAYWADTAQEAAAVVDTLNAFLADGEEGKLTITDPSFGTRWAFCQLVGTPDVEWDGTESGTFSFDVKCVDPRKYGDQVVSLPTTAATSGGALFMDPMFGSVTAPGVADFGDGGSAGTVTWYNEGTADVSPMFTVAGPAPGFTVVEQETSRRVIFDQTIPAGQWLDIDPATATATLNGNVDRSDGIALAQWPSIPGKTARTYMLESADPEATMTVTAAPAWW